MSDYSAPILAGDNPFAYWRMDTTTGNIAQDITGHGNDAMLTGNFFLNQPGALIDDRNTSILFLDAGSGLTLPYTLDITTFPALTLEFWIKIQGNPTWDYIVATCDGSNTLLYRNGTPYPSDSLAPVIEISQIFAWAGSYKPAYLDEIILYNYTLSPERIQAHYQAGTVSSEAPLFVTEQHTIIPTTNIGNFGIGIYQSLSGGTTIGGGFPLISNSLPSLIPYSGVYGGTYGYFIENAIRAPQTVTYQPAQSIGLDAEGVSVVRGYPQIAWNYGTVRPDIWYEFYNLYRRAGAQPYGFQYLVLLQYPDPLQDGALTQVIASWDPLQHGGRDVGSFKQLVLHFSYVGKATLTPSIPIQTRL